jgi:hypothetical protein
MLDEIPKLLGRGFVIGYLLPTLIFVIYITYGAHLDFLSIGPFSEIDVEKLGRATAAIVLLAFVMLLLNRPLVRILEGYYRFNPLRLLTPLSEWRFNKRAKPANEEWERLEGAWGRNENAEPADWLEDKGKIAASAYPDTPRLLLGTAFGNAYRAYEIYPMVLYGMDAVVLWPRLSTILPRAAQAQLQDSRARLDFHVTLFWLSAAATITALAATPTWCRSVQAAPPFILALIEWFSLPAMARSWGISFASMFDLYRRPLAASLGFEIPATMGQERQMWYDINRMMLFRRAFIADSLDHYRVKKQSLIEVGPGDEVEDEDKINDR